MKFSSLQKPTKEIIHWIIFETNYSITSTYSEMFAATLWKKGELRR